jgi:hypothetical protein
MVLLVCCSTRRTLLLYNILFNVCSSENEEDQKGQQTGIDWMEEFYGTNFSSRDLHLLLVILQRRKESSLRGQRLQTSDSQRKQQVRKQKLKRLQQLKLPIRHFRSSLTSSMISGR